MSASSRILCALDFSRPATPAFGVALALSRDGNAELTVVHAVPPSKQSSWRARERIATTTALRAQAGAAGVRLRVSEQHGDAAGVILRHANAGRFDLIVLGTPATTGLDIVRSGSVAERVTAQARCSVLIVPMTEVRHEDRAPFQNILCPLDFTPASDAALSHALHLTRSGGRVTLLHVSPQPMGALRHASSTAPEYSRRRHRDAWHRLQGAVPIDARTTTDIRVRVVAGTPATEITRIALEIGADLVVMGVSAVGAIGRTLNDSTAARVIRSAGRPVLAVPRQALERSDLHPESRSARPLAA